jgi:hypothetical protein
VRDQLANPFLVSLKSRLDDLKNLEGIVVRVVQRPEGGRMALGFVAVQKVIAGLLAYHGRELPCQIMA